MAKKRKGRRSSKAQPPFLHKPKGFFQDRVERAGPAHFGLACFDCHKEYTKWMFADFYGNILIPPQTLPHQRSALQDAVKLLKDTAQQRQITDFIVVLERTGRYHRVVERVLRNASLDVRMVHPFATKQFRQAEHPGDKTDDHDLSALHCAALNGFALREPVLDDFWTSFLHIARYRRTLIHDAAKTRTRIHNDLDAYLPGYIDQAFHDFWKNNCAWPIAQAVLGPQDILQLGTDGLERLLREQGIHFHRRSLPPILAWAADAPDPDAAPAVHRRLALARNQERLHNIQEIRALEVELADFLCRTPYVLMLSCPGLNVATIADLAAELGPLSNYASAKGIAGRTGLRPLRSQSGQVDRASGPLVRCAHRKLRAALLRAADCLLSSNPHFHQMGVAGRAAGEEPHQLAVKVANRLCRILYQVVGGQKVFDHPNCQTRHGILDKLIAFHAEHDSDAATTARDVTAALPQLPPTAYAEEAMSLRERLDALRRGRAKDPQGLAELLPKVLARLGVQKVQSKASGVTSPR
jgi:transposase